MKFKESLFFDTLKVSDEEETGISFDNARPANEITGIEVRLSRVFVKKNKSPIGTAKVYLLNIVSSDVSASPISLELNGFERVRDNHNLAIERTLYLWKKNGREKMPSQIHIMSSLIKSKSGLRNTAEILKKVRDDSEYKDISSNLEKVLHSATSVSAISELIFGVAGIVGGLLGDVQDKPLMTRFQSFTDIGGELVTVGKLDSPFSNPFASIDYTLFIRDENWQQEEDKDLATDNLLAER